MQVLTPSSTGEGLLLAAQSQLQGVLMMRTCDAWITGIIVTHLHLCTQEQVCPCFVARPALDQHADGLFGRTCLCAMHEVCMTGS